MGFVSLYFRHSLFCQNILKYVVIWHFNEQRYKGMMMAVPQMQYVQPGAHLAQGVGVPSGTGVAYQSQPVTYQNQAGAAHTQPPPPPAGNPPKDTEQECLLKIIKMTKI